MFFFKAAFHGNEKEMSFLIENEAKVNVKDNTGKTPLHLAAQKNHTKLISLLIEKGAKVSEQDNEG